VTGDAASLALLEKMNRAHAAQHPGDSRLDARIASYELAAKMQLSAPEAFDVTREPETVRTAYGLDNKATEDFGHRCLLATRLIERGVRFVQVWSGPQGREPTIGIITPISKPNSRPWPRVWMVPSPRCCAT
jgi:hypothetical protein